MLLLCAMLLAIPPATLQRIEEHAGSNRWPALYYDVLPKVIRDHGYKTVVEVGVALGGHAERLLRETALESYVGVDPYAPYDLEDAFQQDVSRYSSASVRENFGWLYEWVKNVRLAPFEGRCRLLREHSIKAASLFADESLDCIFIDGDHRYEAVLHDLRAWFLKLKKGRLILGDDYWMPEVAAAVDHFFASERRNVFFFTADSGYRIWAVYK